MHQCVVLIPSSACPHVSAGSLTRRHFPDRLLILKEIVRFSRAEFANRGSRLWMTWVGVWLALILGSSTAFAIGPSGFLPQTRVGHIVGDQWEPAVAADGFGHVYVLYPQYLTVPNCNDCPVPTMILVVSNSNGSSWETPHEIAPLGTAQYDAQIVVDPADRRTVYAAWLQNKKQDVVVAKSIDFGRSWTVVLAARAGEADKPVLAVRGSTAVVAYNHVLQRRPVGHCWRSRSLDDHRLHLVLSDAVCEVVDDRDGVRSR